MLPSAPDALRALRFTRALALGGTLALLPISTASVATAQATRVAPVRRAAGCPSRMPPEGVPCRGGGARCNYDDRACMCATDGHGGRRWACFRRHVEIVDEGPLPPPEMTS